MNNVVNAKRKEFIGLNTDSASALNSFGDTIRAALPAALDIFYEKLRAEPEIRRHFSDETQISQVKRAQLGHWDNILSGRLDTSYFESAERIGRAHARIDLQPHWYIGGYALIVEQLVAAVLEEAWPKQKRGPKTSHEDVAAALGSMIKAVLLDIDITVSTYEERNSAEREVAISAVKDALKQIAQGDATTRINSDLGTNFNVLQVNFNDAISQIEDAIAAVKTSARVIATGTVEIADAVDDLARRTESGAASLEETAAAVEEISATVSKTATSTTRAREAVATTRTDAESGGNIVNQAVEAMSGIERSSTEIGQIIGVIDEIAFQTNLLALNAGVEAARAGEAGRGFAVVASEVRALAQRSAEAAKQIKMLIATSADQVSTGVELVRQSGEALEQIFNGVAQVDEVVCEIANSAQEQATALHEVAASVSDMDGMTQNNAAMVEESKAATQGLSAEAEELARLSGRFKTSDLAAPHQLRSELEKAVPHAFGKAQKTTGATPKAAEAPAPQPAFAAPPRKAAGAATAAKIQEISTADDWEEF